MVGSTKSLSGHALGAAGVHEAIYSLIMLNRGFLAKSANINDLVEEAEGMNILLDRHVSRSARLEYSFSRSPWLALNVPASRASTHTWPTAFLRP